jgi:hypothetical protein
VLGAACAALLGGVVLLAAIVAGAVGVSVAGSTASEATGAASASPLARSDIPRSYLRLYQAAGARYGVDWAVLAAIGKVECDHGRDPDPSCTREGALNAAGAGGPMQFITSTWARYGVDADGSGRPDRWDPADAVFAAANYLRASGIRHDEQRALLAYNHATWYVAEVEAWASRYRAAVANTAPSEVGVRVEAVAGLDAQTTTPVAFIPGEVARLAPGDGHVALIPSGVPGVVQGMVVAGNELQTLPYGPGGHPDPRGSAEEDCSSTVNYVLFRAGVRPLSEILRENPLAQDYVRWGDPGPGRWVTIFATASPTAHVFIVIAGLRLDTSHGGTDVGPNRAEDGPRWRILGHIPTWARWAVRHPPGL